MRYVSRMKTTVHPSAGLRALAAPQVKRTLARLEAAAKRDKWVFLRAAPAALLSRLRRGSWLEGVLPYLKDAYIPVSPEQGAFLYQTARALRARTIVEFGTSFGISAIYLAAAARENGGRFVGTEIEPNKIEAARANLRDAGLADVSEIRAGDARETLRDFAPAIDFLLLDGWKDLYLPLLEMLAPRLAPRSVVLADNIFTFPTELAPYVAYVRDARNGFESFTLPLGHGLEFSARIDTRG
jgi:predicted O-methyltransferase YrrM